MISRVKRASIFKPWMSSPLAGLGHGRLDNPGRQMRNCHKSLGGHRAQRLCWPLYRSRSCRGAPHGVWCSPSTTLSGQILTWPVMHLVALGLLRQRVLSLACWSPVAQGPPPPLLLLNCFQNPPLWIRLVWVERAWQPWWNSFPSPTAQMHTLGTTWHALSMGYL